MPRRARTRLAPSRTSGAPVHGAIDEGAHRDDDRSSDARTARVAVVTGANHGIGAATAVALAAAGVDVLVTYLRLDDPSRTPVAPTPTPPTAPQDADDVLAAIEPLPGRARRPSRSTCAPTAPPAAVFDEAERRVRPGVDPRQQRQRLAGRHVRAGPDRPARPPLAR